MYEAPITAERIKKTAKTKNLQLKDMLIKLQLNKNTLSNMYNGSMLRGDSLARIADYLEVSVDYLLGRTDNPEINQ
ncbi:MAG: helix-turn-helix domain-containing protein [Clostridiales bacterium]|nr:helix-turn-helix domain-containing protein [Clostridiales bacterium]